MSLINNMMINPARRREIWDCPRNCTVSNVFSAMSYSLEGIYEDSKWQ
jgi:hypothetical protein